MGNYQTKDNDENHNNNKQRALSFIIEINKIKNIKSKPNISNYQKKHSS